MDTTRIDFQRIYHLLSRFKQTDNPDKIYSRIFRSKRQTSALVKRKLKQVAASTSVILLDTELLMADTTTISATSPISPKSTNISSTQPFIVNDVITIPDDDIETNNIVILKKSEYEKIKTSKYSLSDLRLLCGHYGIKKSGTKPEIMARIYIHLKQAHLIVKIQRKFRIYLAEKYRKLNGPGFLKPSICVNDTDFFTFDSLKDIEPHHFFSYLDDDGKVYGFHIASFYNLIISSYPDISNPYNRNIVPLRIIKNVYEKLIYGTLLNLKISIKLEDDEQTTEQISPEKQEELFIVGLFQHINTLGNYSDSEWFMSLKRNDFIRFIRLIYDIWTYRADLTHYNKERICPPTGNPFMLNNSHINVNIINLFSEGELRTMCVSIINKMVMNGITREDQSLGAFYVLASLTMVNQDARNALPWLYEAVL